MKNERDYSIPSQRLGTINEFDGCEWNPEKDTEAFDTDAHFQQTPAEMLVGTRIDQNWRLCRACASLPRFRRFKVTPIPKAGESQVDDSRTVSRGESAERVTSEKDQ